MNEDFSSTPRTFEETEKILNRNKKFMGDYNPQPMLNAIKEVIKDKEYYEIYIFDDLCGVDIDADNEIIEVSLDGTVE